MKIKRKVVSGILVTLLVMSFLTPLLNIQPVKAQTTYSIEGMVYYSTKPLVGIKVDLVQGEVTNPPLMTTTTNSEGYYSFSSVIPGSYWVKAYGPTPVYIGWTASSIEVDSEDITEDIDLPKLMTLTSPDNGADVASLHPTLTWKANPQAANYWVQVNVMETWELVVFLETLSTEHTISATLSQGVEYVWGIDAYDEDGHWVGTTEMAYHFKVALDLTRSDRVPGKGKGLDKPLPNDNFAKGRNK